MSLPADHDPEFERLGYETGSSRRLTLGRRLVYRLAALLGYLYMDLVWRTARLTVLNEHRVAQLAHTPGRVIPVCWHQHLLLCSRYWVARRSPPLEPGFLISPSVDGEGPSMMARMYGCQVIRGSSTHTGTRAIRQLCKAITKEQLSPLITPDGPRGPRFEFKAGALMVGQLSATPVVPLAFAARPAKVLRTWDKFVLVPPFARVVIAVGEPIEVPRGTDEAARETLRLAAQQAMKAAFQRARAAL